MREPRPNVLVLSLAPLRADRLSCYGYGRDTTPHLDALAAEGALFERAYATAAWTPPSYASLLTGLYPARHGVSTGTGLADSIPTLAGVMTERGYRTAGFVSTSFIGRYKRLDRGFTEFYEPFGSRRGAGPLGRAERAWRQVQGAALFQDVLRRKRHLSWRLGMGDKGSARANRGMIDWLTANAESQEPFFLLAHHQEMHHPYLAPLPFRHRYLQRGTANAAAPEWRKVQRLNVNPYLFMTGQVPAEPADFATLSALYDAEVHYLDHLLGELFACLTRLGVLDRTLVIVVSAHGENLGDHGLGEHQGCLYETLVHVPLLVRYPPLIPAGLRVSGLVQLTDLMPTILDATGGGTAGLALDGRSLLPLGKAHRGHVIAEHEGNQIKQLNEIARPADRPLVERFARSLRMIREGDWKYIAATSGGAGGAGSAELYDLAADPEERDNRAAREPERARLLAERLEAAFQAAPGDSVGAGDPEAVERAILEELRSLGYRI
jgi:arylsulfatase A-like enzyme